MPTYTYACEKCGHNLDVVQSFSDNPMRDCPNCGQASLHRVYRPVGIVFKGSGFYATDNRSPSGVSNGQKGSDSTAKSETTTSEPSSPKEGAKPVDNKPAASTASSPAAS